MRPLVTADFFDRAAGMRAEFDARVAPERAAPPQRFVWDYWHVPSQYSYFRTFARRFFSPGLYRNFGAGLRQWGEIFLGTGSYTEPWLSYYIDGCVQELHTDVAQGPWAFVFSLTRWDDRRFTGGETVLAAQNTLDYWRNFDPERPLERGQLLATLAPRFNQLLVFDGRVPHGVARVDGTRDPVHSRIAIHGWFLEPVLSAEGALSVRDIEEPARAVVDTWQSKRTDGGPLHGVASVRLAVDGKGTVTQAEALASTLLSLDGRLQVAETAAQLAFELSRRTRFPLASAGDETIITIPFFANDRR